MQSSAQASLAPEFKADPVVATILGIPAALIVIAALADSSLPVLGNGTGAVAGLLILGNLMCARGIAAMKGRFDLAAAIVGGVAFGILAMFLLVSDFFGWPILLQPIANALGGSGQPATFDRATIVGMGAIMVVKWSIAWTSYRPRKS
jgi:hypothetical protein